MDVCLPELRTALVDETDAGEALEDVVDRVYLNGDDFQGAEAFPLLLVLSDGSTSNDMLRGSRQVAFDGNATIACAVFCDHEQPGAAQAAHDAAHQLAARVERVLCGQRSRTRAEEPTNAWHHLSFMRGEGGTAADEGLSDVLGISAYVVPVHVGFRFIRGRAA